MTYDSTADTLAHIARVQELLREVRQDLMYRMIGHDRSKLVEPEKSTFDRVTPQLAELEYGTPEYKAALADMGPALEHHYAVNDHHPEHFEGGIEDMDLVQLMEMLADWKAAGERHADSKGLEFSIRQNRHRFGYSEQLQDILLNTARRLGWL